MAKIYKQKARKAAASKATASKALLVHKLVGMYLLQRGKTEDLAQLKKCALCVWPNKISDVPNCPFPHCIEKARHSTA